MNVVMFAVKSREKLVRQAKANREKRKALEKQLGVLCKEADKIFEQIIKLNEAERAKK